MRKTIDIVAARLGGVVDWDEEYEDDGVVDMSFEADDIFYPVPADLSQEDGFAFEGQLRALLELERAYRRKWVSE